MAPASSIRAFATRCLAWTFLIPSLLHAQPIPKPRDGWQMELVAQAPHLRHPTVVACAPDGRVFVAEDPMDISRPANAAEGRILCLHPDGRQTVFAEKLHAVFGLQYIEGQLFVLHNPRFTVFHDDHGIARNPIDLIEETNPNLSTMFSVVLVWP